VAEPPLTESSPDSKFGFGLVGIAQALSRRLAVPIYQRSYAWGDDDHDRDQVDEFWSDLRSSFLEKDGEYFVGTIVLSKTGSTSGTATVIDGQQRLATTALLLAAIRDEFDKRGDANRGRIIHEKYLASSDLRSAAHIPQLTLNSEDDPFCASSS
jgi:uncharacterized protein with ParB-like and HNH nuclease domain